MTIEELTEFTNSKFKDLGITKVTAAKQLGISRQLIHSVLTNHIRALFQAGETTLCASWQKCHENII